MSYLLAAMVGAIISYGIQLLWKYLERTRSGQQISTQVAQTPTLLDSDEPGYSFRIRVNRAPGYTIQTQLQEISLPSVNSQITLSLRATGSDGNLSSLRDAQYWILVGRGFETETAALTEGTRLQQNLLVGLTRARLGADFGWAGPSGIMTSYGEQYFSQEQGRRVLQDLHGLKVFKTSPRPVFMNMSFQAMAAMDEGRSIDILQRTFQENIVLTERKAIAYQLYQISKLQSMSEIRFLLLVTALETIIEETKKSPLAVTLIDQFEQTILKSPLSPEEKNSFKGSLRHLRNVSIGQGGKALIEQIASTATFQGMAAGAFFSKVYELRSQLVHGGGSFEIREKIKNWVADTELLTHAVLTGLDPICSP